MGGVRCHRKLSAGTFIWASPGEPLMLLLSLDSISCEIQSNCILRGEHPTSGSACPLQGKGLALIWLGGWQGTKQGIIPPCPPAGITTGLPSTPRVCRSPNVSWLSLFSLAPQAALEHGESRASWEPWLDRTHKPMPNKAQTGSIAPRPRPPMPRTRR